MSMRMRAFDENLRTSFTEAIARGQLALEPIGWSSLGSDAEDSSGHGARELE